MTSIRQNVNQMLYGPQGYETTLSNRYKRRHLCNPVWYVTLPSGLLHCELCGLTFFDKTLFEV